MNLESQKNPKFDKLSTGGDIYRWIMQMQLHFQSLNLWEHVNENAAIAVGENETPGTAQARAALCKRDIILSLETR